jgi:hypothetical protein
MSASLLSATLVFSMGSIATADTHNPNINIGKADLKAKCNRSGGDWKVEKNGVYRCVVHNDDSTTVVECKNRECDGYVFDRDRTINRNDHKIIKRIATRLIAR